MIKHNDFPRRKTMEERGRVCVQLTTIPCAGSPSCRNLYRCHREESRRERTKVGICKRTISLTIFSLRSPVFSRARPEQTDSSPPPAVHPPPKWASSLSFPCSISYFSGLNDSSSSDMELEEQPLESTLDIMR